jgi:hypothetical protein
MARAARWSGAVADVGMVDVGVPSADAVSMA